RRLAGAVRADESGAAAAEGSGDVLEGGGAVRPGEREVVQDDGARVGHGDLPGAVCSAAPVGVSARGTGCRSGGSSSLGPSRPPPHTRVPPAGTSPVSVRPHAVCKRFTANRLPRPIVNR